MNVDLKVSSCTYFFINYNQIFNFYNIWYLGYIGGESCVVPAGAKRTDYPTHEEVHIPVSKMSKELTIGKELIPITTLDEVVHSYCYIDL